MKRIAMVLTVAVLAASFGLSFPAEAQTATGVKPKSSTSHKVPMHPHQLTLYPHGRPERRHPAHSYTRHPFNQPSPIHNTSAGVAAAVRMGFSEFGLDHSSQLRSGTTLYG
jgi:hypothetical protein